MRTGNRFFGFRNKHFRHENSSGGRHDDRAEQMFGLDTVENVGAHDPARNVGHAGRHYRHQFGAGERRDVGPDSERSFGLAHEDAGRNVKRFRPAGAHADHDLGGLANDELHDPVVIEHGKKC